MHLCTVTALYLLNAALAPAASHISSAKCAASAVLRISDPSASCQVLERASDISVSPRLRGAVLFSTQPSSKGQWDSPTLGDSCADGRALSFANPNDAKQSGAECQSSLGLRGGSSNGNTSIILSTVDRGDDISRPKAEDRTRAHADAGHKTSTGSLETAGDTVHRQGQRNSEPLALELSLFARGVSAVRQQLHCAMEQVSEEDLQTLSSKHGISLGDILQVTRLKPSKCVVKGCTSPPRFAAENATHAILCALHAQNHTRARNDSSPRSSKRSASPQIMAGLFRVPDQQKRCQAAGASCKQVAIYGYARDGIARFCRKHKLAGCKDVRSKRCLSPEGCSVLASFGEATEDGSCGKPLFCMRHKLPRHVNVKRRSCTHRGCTRVPSHGPPGARASTCGEHRLASHQLVDRKGLCRAAGCGKEASYGPPKAEGGEGGGVRLFCPVHRLAGHVDHKFSKRCAAGGCVKRALWAESFGAQPTACGEHRGQGQVYIGYKIQCEAPGCQRGATHGLPHAHKRTACAQHKRSVHVDLARRPCEFEGCFAQPTYAPTPDAQPRFCAKHRPEGFQLRRHKLPLRPTRS